MYCLEECKKIRMREKQLELEDWMRMYGDEYVEVGNLYRWVGRK